MRSTSTCDFQRMKYLLDTNVLKELTKITPHQNVAKWLASVDDRDLHMSVISVREITKGIGKLRKDKPEKAAEIESKMTGIYASFAGRIEAIDEAVAKEWGRLLSEADKHTDDTGLAATAKVQGMVLVTRNVDDVKGRGARVLDPFKSPAKII